MNNTTNTESARLAFRNTAIACASCPEDEETAILSIGREFLPACALTVLDGGEGTVEYYDWLRGQTERAQAENDAAVAAGHEWHE